MVGKDSSVPQNPLNPLSTKGFSAWNGAFTKPPGVLASWAPLLEEGGPAGNCTGAESQATRSHHALVSSSAPEGGEKLLEQPATSRAAHVGKAHLSVTLRSQV